eukprot:gene36351-44097_t
MDIRGFFGSTKKSAGSGDSQNVMQAPPQPKEIATISPHWDDKLPAAQVKVTVKASPAKRPAVASVAANDDALLDSEDEEPQERSKRLKRLKTTVDSVEPSPQAPVPSSPVRSPAVVVASTPVKESRSALKSPASGASKATKEKVISPVPASADASQPLAGLKIAVTGVFRMG